MVMTGEDLTFSQSQNRITWMTFSLQLRWLAKNSLQVGGSFVFAMFSLFSYKFIALGLTVDPVFL